MEWVIPYLIAIFCTAVGYFIYPMPHEVSASWITKIIGGIMMVLGFGSIFVDMFGALPLSGSGITWCGMWIGSIGGTFFIIPKKIK